MKQKLSDRELEAVKFLLESKINPQYGLEDDLFYLVSALSPIANVDLLILNEKNHVLLSWRNDDFYEKGWHLPGGCLRYGESFEYRIQQTAMIEIGTKVIFDNNPITVKNVIRGEAEHLKNKYIRGHNVAILFKCHLPKKFAINNKNLSENTDGYLKWFDEAPFNMLTVHKVYDDIFYNIGFKKK